MSCLNFIGVELENPFGQDANDLPLDHFQDEMNNCHGLSAQRLRRKSAGLLMLLHNSADILPDVDSTRCMTDVDAARLRCKSSSKTSRWLITYCYCASLLVSQFLASKMFIYQKSDVERRFGRVWSWTPRLLSSQCLAFKVASAPKWHWGFSLMETRNQRVKKADGSTEAISWSVCRHLYPGLQQAQGEGFNLGFSVHLALISGGGALRSQRELCRLSPHWTRPSP